MARDDIMDRELSQLEEEIEAKVDSLFVEMEEGEGAGPSAEDPWRELKEHFLTLEWEIDLGVLEKISQSVQRLRTRYENGSLGLVLGWMAQVAEKIKGCGTEVEKESIALLHQLKDGLMRIVEDPPKDPGMILDPLRGKVNRFLLSEEEEAPTVTVEAIRGEGDFLFDELDRAVEEALVEEEPLLAEEPVSEAPGEAEGETVEFEGLGVEETVEPEIGAEFLKGLEEEIEEGIGREEAPRREVLGVPLREAVPVSAQEAPAPAVEPEEELEGIRRALAESGAHLGRFLDGLEGDPLGLRAALQGVSERFRDLSQSLGGIVTSLQERIRALEELDLVRRPQEPTPEPQPNREEVLFISVSSRIFGIPIGAVRGVFRVPSKAVSQIVQAAEVELKGRTVPLISLWKKLGLGRALYTFPKEEKRVLLVASGTGEVGLLVDQVLARQEVTLRPVEAEQRALFRGMVTVEKGAYVIDIETL